MARTRIVVVGGGFAGMECARRLEHKLSDYEAEIVLISPRNYQLYLPLLPNVAAGVLTPQSVAVSLRRILRRTIMVPGGVVGIDTKAKVCVVRRITDDMSYEPYDFLVLAPGSITRQFNIPGLDAYGRGMKTLAEAAFIRDHVIAQLELAAQSNDELERAGRLQFVVVGGGYAGTETAACLQRLTTAAMKRYPRLDPNLVKWHLIDIAPRLMPELGVKLGEKAVKVLRRRGVDVTLGLSVAEADEDTVKLTDGRSLPCHTLIWTAGVAASPLVSSLDAQTVKGRLVTDAEMRVPGLDRVFALGDAAAVPDLAVGDDAICPPTAQHAQRQGKQVAKNIIEMLRGKDPTPYHHKDLGLVVDLGGFDAVSKPLGIPLSGPPAQAVARGYHVMAMRTTRAKMRVTANWFLNTVAGDDFVRTGLVADRPSAMHDFEHTDPYLTQDQIHREVAALRAGQQA